MAHFSKYIRPGAVRVGLDAALPEGVWATAAQNPDGSFAVVVFNDNTTPRFIEIDFGGQQVATQVSADSLQTILYLN
ncbi:glycoside hydrolase family 30 beta sandwich domain-containing protein [Lentimonas sp. CC4]|uniref:glycoside hydrolase family 30 beta sandwich domain-containing protein n=1 Tax=unclassified Lentimonas TaxID=2630993 RepID=UPI0032AE8160